MKNLSEIEKIIKANKKELEEKFGLKKIGIFGSIAKGAEKEASDIDIVVEFDKPIGLSFVDFVEYLERILNNEIDVLTLEGIENIRVKKIIDDIKRNIIYV